MTFLIITLIIVALIIYLINLSIKDSDKEIEHQDNYPPFLNSIFFTEFSEEDKFNAIEDIQNENDEEEEMNE